ncbi:MAG: electron transfer flavoprotein subunit beta/FixA family protein, partial [Saprospiraceae bacterium]
RIAFKNEGSTFDSTGVNFIMNPYDEWYALVRALELKEEKGGSVTVIHCGPAANEVIIRKALAIGADDAVRVDMEPLSAYSIATQIAAYAKDQSFDLILTGKETIDFNESMVGGMVAELMELPFISHVSKMVYNGSNPVLTRDIEGGVEEIEVTGPYVISASKGLAEQRIPNMRGIMSAKTKPLQIIQAVTEPSLADYIHFQSPVSKSSVKMIDPNDMDELVRLLHEVAKVI